MTVFQNTAICDLKLRGLLIFVVSLHHCNVHVQYQACNFVIAKNEEMARHKKLCTVFSMALGYFF